MNIKNSEIKEAISKLANVIRAENIETKNYLDLYVGEDALESIDNVNNQVIYGRRGSGKTHLLKALQEKQNRSFESQRKIAIYIDARTLLPHANSGAVSSEEYSVILFRHVIQTIINAFTINVREIFGRSHLIPTRADPLDTDAQAELARCLSIINLQFNGQSLIRLSEVSLTREEIKQQGASGTLSQTPSLNASMSSQTKTSASEAQTKYISIYEITNALQTLVEWLDLARVICLVDEWSEIPMSSQRHLAELIKKCFIPSKFTFKIAAIPNRTDLGSKTEEKFYGLEDGGDVFGYQLDNRYVFEIDKTKTRNFFNQLLCKHLEAVHPGVSKKLLGETKKSDDGFINSFLTNKALGEILIASAGIPRDFIHLFIHSYDQFKASDSKHISVKNVRAATSGWYETDKKKQVDDHQVERRLLENIVSAIVVAKGSSHFMIAEKHSSNPHLLSLIDFRVLHLRKKGYSHKDLRGETFNVYSIDYGCYNHLNITRTALDNRTLENLSVHDDIREIRRIYLDDSFFEKFQLNIGEAFNCPHCKKPVDTKHLAFIKRSICNHCYESIDAPTKLAVA